MAGIDDFETSINTDMDGRTSPATTADAVGEPCPWHQAAAGVDRDGVDRDAAGRAGRPAAIRPQTIPMIRK